MGSICDDFFSELPNGSTEVNDVGKNPGHVMYENSCRYPFGKPHAINQLTMHGEMKSSSYGVLTSFEEI